VLISAGELRCRGEEAEGKRAIACASARKEDAAVENGRWPLKWACWRSEKTRSKKTKRENERPPGVLQIPSGLPPTNVTEPGTKGGYYFPGFSYEKKRIRPKKKVRRKKEKSHDTPGKKERRPSEEKRMPWGGKRKENLFGEGFLYSGKIQPSKGHSEKREYFFST